MMKSILILIAAFSATAAIAGDNVTFPQGNASVITNRGEVVHFTVEIATTPPQQEKGLMYRKKLAMDHGMIFVIENPRPIQMWMKNTFIPLDMVFADNHNKIIKIVKNTRPESTDIISSGGEVKTVLEIKGGAADYYHIATGNTLVFP
jgi:uncharacterized membrane protein (UPF0127 family)